MHLPARHGGAAAVDALRVEDLHEVARAVTVHRQRQADVVAIALDQWIDGHLLRQRGAAH
jgi:hypothetical protein